MLVLESFLRHIMTMNLRVLTCGVLEFFLGKQNYSGIASLMTSSFRGCEEQLQCERWQKSRFVLIGVCHRSLSQNQQNQPLWVESASHNR